MDAVTKLRMRAVAKYEQKDVWLAARARGMTATEVRELRKGAGPAYMTELIAMKRAGGGQRDLSGVKHIQHGNEREPIIADWIRGRFGIEANDYLFHALGNTRHLATPDGVGLNFDEELIISEIKTSKYNLDPALSGQHFDSTGYYYQIQWQLYVTGAQRCLFVWEQHDDDWSGWPGRAPKPVGAPKHYWIERDNAEITQLRAFADEALVQLDADPVMKAAVGDDLVALAREYREALQLEALAADQKKRSWEALLKHMQKLPGDSYKAQGISVFWKPATVTNAEVLDAEAAMEASPELYAQMQDARSAWDAHLSGFTRTEPREVRASLRVTTEKENK